MSITSRAALLGALLAAALASGCGSGVTDPPDPEPVRVADQSTPCPVAPDIVLRRSAQQDCEADRGTTGYPGASGQALG